MNYRVVVTPQARNELYGDAIWWADHRSSEQALRWLDGFESTIKSLGDNPEQHPFARENERFTRELRQVLYGLGKKPTHRAVFEIREGEVVVHGIRHLARRDIVPEDFNE